MKAAGNKTVIENAVVGIVDMVSSTKLSNSVDVFTDWEIKERFFQAAQDRAAETGMLILNLTGDGFVFLANPKGGFDWAASLREFQTRLVADYREILSDYSTEIGNVKSGIRFGVAQGPIIVGQVAGQERRLAVGAAINLAARLCASAKVDEMAMSSSVWEVYGAVVRNAEAAMCAYPQLKGFDHVIVGFHVTAPIEIASKRDVLAAMSSRWAGTRMPQAA